MTTTPEQPYEGVAYLGEQAAVPTVVGRAENRPLEELPAFYDSTFQALFPALGAAGLRPTGPAFGLYTRVPSESADLEAGITVDRPAEGALPEGLFASEIPAGRVAATTHIGPFEGLGPAWQAFIAAVKADGHTTALPFWEVYVSEPSPESDPSTLRTDLYTLLEG